MRMIITLPISYQSWGSNEYGELGIGVIGGNIRTPYAIGTGWKQVAAGMQYSLGIRTNGTLWAWGRNNFGELGLGDTDIRGIPTQVGNDSDWVYVAAPAYPWATAPSRDAETKSAPS